MCPPPKLVRHGFTLIELAIALIVTVLVVLIAAAVLSRPKHYHGQMSDGTQLRGIHQGFVMWAGDHQDTYPRPSLVDTGDDTVPLAGAAKDTTANIISLLVYNGFIGPEICISPAEANPAVKSINTYAYSIPASATRPAKALWDPSFSTDFTAGHTSNFSYAHLLPAGPRAPQWSFNYDPNAAIIGNRGPLIPSITHAAGTSTYPAAPASSITYLIHGGRTTWEGTIIYNDNRGTFESNMAPDTSQYLDVSGHKWNDCFFADEPDDAVGTNNYLGNFISAGAKVGDFTPIWD